MGGSTTIETISFATNQEVNTVYFYDRDKNLLDSFGHDADVGAGLFTYDVPDTYLALGFFIMVTKGDNSSAIDAHFIKWYGDNPSGFVALGNPVSVVYKDVNGDIVKSVSLTEGNQRNCLYEPFDSQVVSVYGIDGFSVEVGGTDPHVISIAPRAVIDIVKDLTVELGEIKSSLAAANLTIDSLESIATATSNEIDLVKASSILAVEHAETILSDVESVRADTAETLILIKRLLSLSEGRTEEGDLGNILSPSVVIFDSANQPIQELTVEGDIRTAHRSLVMDRTENIPTVLRITTIDENGTSSEEVETVKSAPLVEPVIPTGGNDE